jgi:transposase
MLSKHVPPATPNAALQELYLASAPASIAVVEVKKAVDYANGGGQAMQCEAIAQPPAPFHVTPRGFAGPSLLAMILFEKFGQHQPLNRQSERYAREGIDLSLSTLADRVGACAPCTH